MPILRAQPNEVKGIREEKIRTIFTLERSLPPVKKVIFNAPATIVMWGDGTKTVVKAYNEPFDKEKGLAMAICKKIYGNKGNYNNVFKKFIGEIDG